jgi:toxin secretion/phage lysis holin
MDRQVDTVWENLDYISDPLKWAAALTVGLWTAVPELTQLLVTLMVIDIVLGLMVARKLRNLSAKAAWDGAQKKVTALILVAVAALLSPRIQPIIEINLVQAASAFYIVPELLSITRNAAILDVPVFNQMTVVLRYFQAVSETEKREDKPLPQDADRTVGGRGGETNRFQ